MAHHGLNPETREPDFRQIGRYRLTAELGRGAMGTVYRAEDPLNQRELALKVLDIQCRGPAQKDFRKTFFLEARVAGSLDHPNIVAVRDVGESRGTPYVAMELLAGRNLRQTLDEGAAMSLRTLLGIAMQVARGLDYAHQHGVIHRDIKPANIMLLPDGTVKIMDFGIAHASAGAALAETTMGSPGYMAPEQFARQPVDPRTDIFSLGVTLYEALTGKQPFGAISVPSIIQRILTTDPPPPSSLNPEVPAELDRIVMRAIAKSPQARFASAQELGAALESLIDALPDNGALSRASSPLRTPTPGEITQPIARPSVAPTAPEPAPRPAPRGIVWLTLGLGGLLAAVFLLGREAPPGDDVNTAVAPPLASAPPSSPKSIEPAAAPQAPPEPVAAREPPDTLTLDPSPPIEAAESAPPAQTAAPPALAAAPEPASPVVPAPPGATRAARGTLALSVLPWGEVLVNGRSRGVTPPLRELDLPPGTYRLEIRNADFPPHAETVRIRPGKAHRLEYRFR